MDPYRTLQDQAEARRRALPWWVRVLAMTSWLGRLWVIRRRLWKAWRSGKLRSNWLRRAGVCQDCRSYDWDPRYLKKFPRVPWAVRCSTVVAGRPCIAKWWRGARTTLKALPAYGWFNDDNRPIPLARVTGLLNFDDFHAQLDAAAKRVRAEQALKANGPPQEP